MDVKASQIGMLSKLLDVVNLRHGVISQNVANINTPGYHRQEVAFEEAFLKRLGKDGKIDLRSLQPKIVEVNDGAERGDGNNVDIDAELGRLSKNAVLHNSYVQLLTGNIAMMRSAIAGR
jgi:flagellar basal-body rod protein FlgB